MVRDGELASSSPLPQAGLCRGALTTTLCLSTHEQEESLCPEAMPRPPRPQVRDTGVPGHVPHGDLGEGALLGGGGPPLPDRPAEGLQGLAPCFSTLKWEKPPPGEL